MKATVLRCDVLGQLQLTTLCKRGHEVQGWLRVPQPFCSVNIIETDGSVLSEPLTANDPDFLASSELLTVTLKAWQVSDAVKYLVGILPVTAPTVLVHNGMGTVEELRGVKQPLPLVSITQAARRNGNVIIHVAQGATHIDPAKSYEEDYGYLAEVLQSVLPNVAWHNHTYPATWRKLAVDCVISPLTALKGCKNGNLRHYLQGIAAICQEVAAVTEREDIHTSAENLLFYVEQVIESTVENISSTLQDIHTQWHTEINYITGFLLNRARAHGVAAPESARLFELIERKENEHERVGTDLSRPW